MVDQPLQAFHPPEGLEIFFAQLNLSAGAAIQWLLYAIFAFWAIYTLIAIYHWLKYSHASWLTFPAIAVHLGISVTLMSYALSGNLPSL